MLHALRATLVNLLFYGNMVVWIIAWLPTLFGPPSWALAGLKAWSRHSLWLLRVTAGIDFEIRGRENLPPGGCIIAAKHQSMWETFALMPYLDKPVYILKRELLAIPGFGWYARRGGMISVERARHAQALRRMTHDAREAVQNGAQLIIFPEGTRKPVGAEPDYKSGIIHLYKQLGVPVVPAGLNSGLFWGRKPGQRHQGKVIISLLPAIPPGEDGRAVLASLETQIETETAALVDEALDGREPPPWYKKSAA